MKIFLDSYSRRARLEPALIVALPLGLATLAWFPTGLVSWSLMWSLIVYCGGTALLSQLARDRGKHKEKGLYDSWGGKPTIRFLRYRDATNTLIVERRHHKLQALLPDLQIPTSLQEESAPTKADQIYEACSAYLIEKTRDRDRFPLIFEENCNYGFRRNLWGMKPMGVTIALAGTLAVILLIVLDLRRRIIPHPVVVISALANILLFLGWLLRCTPNWVKLTAEAYAERLLAACDNL